MKKNAEYLDALRWRCNFSFFFVFESGECVSAMNKGGLDKRDKREMGGKGGVI